MSKSKPLSEKILEKNSSRHHYIPQFLIKGFTDSNGLLHIYDKQSDKILTNQRPPKSIFFETDRNTIEIKSGLKSSIIEDSIYSEIDNETSKVVKHYQTEELTKINFNIEDTGILFFFLISSFWRIPKTDYAFEDFMNRTVITNTNIDPEKLKNDPDIRKLFRSTVFDHHINEIYNHGKQGLKLYNIHQNENPIYVIGDYPFLLRNQPHELSKFYDTDILFAVSSTRLFSCTNDSLINFGPENSYSYNAAIIHQSEKYVACRDLHSLEQSVKLYKELKRIGLIYSNEHVFLQF